MKTQLTTTKIFRGILGALFVVLGVALLFSGAGIIGGLIAAAPLVAPVIKSADIGDTDKLAAELNAAFKTMSTGMKEAIATEYKEKGAISLTDIDKKLKELGIEDKTVETINEALTTHGLEIEKNRGSVNEKSGLKGLMAKAFSTEGLQAKIKETFNSGSGVLDITKAVANITTGNVTTDTGGNAVLDMLNADEINDLRLNSPFIEDFATTGKTSKPVYTYVDYLPGEGDINFIAEGGEKPQLDLDITVKTEAPVKAAGYEVLTEESIDDIPRMESNARSLLFKKYLLKRQNGILFGDGAGANPTGVTIIASAFNPLTWVGDKILAPNLHDCVIAAANQIYTTTSYTDDVEFYPNVMFVNPADFAALRVTKDKNNNYIFPSFSLFNDKTIDGIKIVSKNKIPAGYMLIGDFTKLNIIDYIAYSVRIGWINDQFIKNLFTMLGEGRFYVFVRALEQRGFIYDTIANVKAGIEDIVN
ncbi:MAG: phage major capsid protein [Candidatus Peribacteraceae bacterium]|nr:phage major capsid protein [Candidatus Peribacteraceae bacterium]